MVEFFFLFERKVSDYGLGKKSILVRVLPGNRWYSQIGWFEDNLIKALLMKVWAEYTRGVVGPREGERLPAGTSRPKRLNGGSRYQNP